MTHAYKISGMTCGSCVARVKSELLKLGDVLSAEIQLQSPQALISMSKHIDTAVLQQAIQKAGNYAIAETGHKNHVADSGGEMAGEKPSYLPIFLIFGYIGLASTLVQVVRHSFSWMQWMSHFMAGFFFVFSFFKMMNLRGFADGYRSYDVVAKHIPAWAFIYPFIELGLGIAFLTGFNPMATGIITFFIMGISSIGVIQSLLKKQTFQCACLGTVIKLPLGKVTLFEDLLMVVMSAAMLIAML